VIDKFALIGSSALLALTATANAQAAPTLNDAAIAHIAYTAGNIDIAAARQALQKSKNPKVRSFAQEMLRDHEAVNKQALALVGKLHVTPQPNATSTSLEGAAKGKLQNFAKLNGAAFDRAYAANEVGYHKTVNAALEGTLIPNAQNGELKSLLQTGLTLFREHQTHAEHLASSLK
jgi:putative membrane protein